MANEHDEDKPPESGERRPEHDEARRGPEVTDKRRIDPETGKRREQAPEADRQPADTAANDVTDEELQQLLADAEGDDATAGSGEGASRGEPESDRLAAERLADLKRIQAEYANYRRRTDRERAAFADTTTADIVRRLLPALDDLDRAEQHGDLEEGSTFAVIAQKLRGVFEKLGVTTYGEKGEPFDPQQHEAIAQLPSDSVDRPTIADVVARGYRIGDREIRAAKVAVFTPAEAPTQDAPAATGADDEGDGGDTPSD